MHAWSILDPQRGRHRLLHPDDIHRVRLNTIERVERAELALAADRQDNIADIQSRMRLELRGIGIPPRPAILDRIRREVDGGEPDFKRLSMLIGSDVALSAGLLKLANSPYFGFGRKVRSVPDALLVLGVQVVVKSVAGLALGNAFANQFAKQSGLVRFWDASTRTARVCGWLTRHTHLDSRLRADDAYTFGLFRDCGVPILMTPFPEYLAVLKQANATREESFTTVEDRALSINHAVVGADLTAEWRLPEELTIALRHHHDADFLATPRSGADSDTAQTMIAVAVLAEHLIQQQTGLNQTREWDKLGESCLQILELTPAELSMLYHDCQSVVEAKSD